MKVNKQVWGILLSQLLGGIGAAAGITVGALLVQSMSSTTVAGFAQAISMLGAALLALPLALMAQRKGRGLALISGYGLASLGAITITLSAVWSVLPLMLLGMMLFGAATAVGLQARYAAADFVPAHARGKVLSIVLWATTLGSVLGPNMGPVALEVARSLGVPELTGHYLLSMVAFILAAIALGWLTRRGTQVTQPREPSEVEPAITRPDVGWITSMRWALRNPAARFAIVMTVVAHMVMVGVMVMTPVHMYNHGHGMGVVGVIISLHIAGMYAASPVFGWLADKHSGRLTAFIGVVILLASAVLGVFTSHKNVPVLTLALILLGLGWSASLIGASTILASAVPGQYRTSVQGSTDSLMNLAGAMAAAGSGVLLGFGGFILINLVAALLLLPAVLLGLKVRQDQPVIPDIH